MTISSTTNRVSYSGNGSTTAFSFPYYFLANGDLVVILVSSAGVETTKTITTHYTVSGAGDSGGGTVTMITAPASGETLVIYRSPALTQSLDLVENDALPAESLEQSLDRITMIAQRLASRLDSSLHLPTQETPSETKVTMPTVTDRASNFLAFDASGNPIAAAGTTGVTVSSYMETVLDDTTAAAARTTLGFSGASGTAATANIEDSAVTTAKIAAANVTKAKLDGSTTSGSSELSNIGITASVAANALTIALKTKAGTDATSTDVISVGMRNSTATTGTYNLRQVTGSLSMTVSSGSTLGHASAVNQYVYVYLIDNAGTLELAVSGEKVFDQGSLISTTAEGGAGAADTATVMYSTTARSNVPFRLIGRLKSNQSTAGTWASAITEISLFPFEQNPYSISEVEVHTGNGHGSTNTKIRRYTTTLKSTGSAITYADSSTNGASFTINENGVYYMQTTDLTAGSTEQLGISLNSSQLTTNIASITLSDRIGFAYAQSSSEGQVSACRYLRAGDVIRPHTDGSSGYTGSSVNFHIIKIS